MQSAIYQRAVNSEDKIINAKKWGSAFGKRIRVIEK
jgi:hypothetical protein